MFDPIGVTVIAHWHISMKHSMRGNGKDFYFNHLNVFTTTVKHAHSPSKAIGSFFFGIPFKKKNDKYNKCSCHPTHMTQRKCWWINSPWKKMAVRKKKWWDVLSKKRKQNKSQKYTRAIFNARAVILSKSAVTRAPAASTHTWIRSVSLVRLLWFIIYIQRKGWRCDCQQGHESNLKTIPGHGVNLKPWLNEEAGEERVLDRQWMTAEEDAGHIRTWIFCCTCCFHDYSLLHIQGLHVNRSFLHNNLHFINKTILPLDTWI